MAGKEEVAIPKKEVALIYNPRAGKFKRDPERRSRRVAAVLADSGFEVRVCPTWGPGTATEAARDAVNSGADIVIAAGGDGTINEVAQGLVGSPVPLALLPGGTANVLCVETRIGTKLLHAARQLHTFQAVPVTIGEIRGQDSSRYFLSMAGVGFDASVVRNLDPRLKYMLGKGAYWLTTLGQLPQPLQQFKVEVNGNTYLSSFLLASRIRNYGGELEIAPTIRLFDDDFEVIIFEGSHVIQYLPYFLRIASGPLRAGDGIIIERAKSLTIQPTNGKPVWTQVDGEIAGSLPATVSVAPQALHLLVPESFRTRYEPRG